MDDQGRQPLKFPNLEQTWIPVIVGILAFWGFTGGAILNPLNLDWMLSTGGDPVQHYLGWNFFRREPFFQFPVGKTLAFGEAIGSSVVFTDSIPLFAFVFRVFGPVLPDRFQYFGLWVLTSFVLQSVFAWRLLTRLTANRALLTLATAFFALSPIMLWRLHGHEALMGHWVILAALDIYFDDRPKMAKWALLVGVTCLIHGYLFAMVGAIWLTDLIRRMSVRQSRVPALCAELLIVIAVAGGTAWTAGYFIIAQVPRASGSGFGYYRLNLLAPFSPLSIWSVFGSTINHGGDYEGFSYLGAGIILLAVLVAATRVFNRRRIAASRAVILPLAILNAGLVSYALSHHVAFGSRELFSYNYPNLLEPLTATFRVSGRFVWPVVYMFELALFALFFASVRPRRAMVLLSLMLLVQAVDVSKASNHFRSRWKETWTSPLQSTFWDEVPQLYRRIAFVLPSGWMSDYAPLALLASDHRMTINGGQFARVDPAKVAAAQNEMRTTVQCGRFRADTLYVFNDADLWEQAIDTFDRNGFVGTVDGLKVVAPNYQGCRAACGLNAARPSKPRIPVKFADGVIAVCQ
jgi:hypothetical protein